ncbi:hypothetical protein [Actinophytocola sp. NPDC049390]|uniref:hypothetical protein n=1 Tax=Actinophytocola sp. NPDC049390 TaxID=3363894 RepID=UPI0037B824C2
MRRDDRPIESGGPVRATFVAVGELLLWPQSVRDRAVTTEEAAAWPAFALVVGERRDLLDSPARALLDLLEHVRRTERPVSVAARCRWTVANAPTALLRLTVQARQPILFDVDILVPTARLLGLLPAVARGVPFALTTNRHLRDLGDAVDVRRVLRHVVVVQSPPVPELAEIADELAWSRPPVDGSGPTCR